MWRTSVVDGKNQWLFARSSVLCLGETALSHHRKIREISVQSRRKGILPLETDLYPKLPCMGKCCLILMCLTLRCPWFASLFEGLQIMDTWMGFPCLFRNAVIDSIYPYQPQTTQQKQKYTYLWLTHCMIYTAHDVDSVSPLHSITRDLRRSPVICVM